jgi:hypothetical protein
MQKGNTGEGKPAGPGGRRRGEYDQSTLCLCMKKE